MAVKTKPTTRPEPPPRPESPERRPRVKRPGVFREVGRNLRRRKLRSFLTLSGIALGAFSLTVMGSLAENFNNSVGSLRDFLSQQVLVQAKGSSVFFSAGHVPISLVEEIERVDGVAVAVPNIAVLVEEDPSETFGPPQEINGLDIARAERSPYFDLDLASGRRIKPGERWKIVLGADLATGLGNPDDPLGPGDKVTIRKHRWEVVGVGKATGTPIDTFAVASIADARVVAKEEDPFLNADEVADSIQVYPEDGVEPDDLAAEIEKVVGDRGLVFPPAASSEEIERISAIWNSIILGSGLVALIVGGVAIINTMIFSVTERTREIGIKKAIGASRRDILREFLTEAALLSFLGGLFGGGVGYLFTQAVNAASRDRGVLAFLVTPRLFLFVFLLSVVIGIGAGFLPARRAARIDPVRALRTLG